MRSVGIASYCCPYTSGIADVQKFWMSARVESIDASYFDDTCALAVPPAMPAMTPKAITVAIATPTNLWPSLFLSSLPFLSIGS